MATIMRLPLEVITIILGCQDLSPQDIMNFKCMWEQFRPTAIYDINWEGIFSKRWPTAKKLYDNQSKENEQKESREKEEKAKESLNFMETCINCARQLRKNMSQIIQKYYNNNMSIDNMTDFVHIFRPDQHFKHILFELINEPKNFVKYSFFVDEIKSLLTQSPRRTGCDLTERYCNIKMFHYMRIWLTHEKWRRLLKQPYKEQLLEQTATILARHIQVLKDVSYSHVKLSLDSIAREVLNCLREKHPDHSIFSTSAEAFSYWENNNIDDNYWNAVEGTQLMDTLDECIFGTLNFRPCKSKDKNSGNMCIDNVLKKKYGQEIILLTIYHSVARRLGLRCDVIRLRIDSHNPRPSIQIYCIYWKPKYATNSLENIRCFNISSKKFPDCFVNQLSLFKTLYLRNSRDVYTIKTAKQLWNEISDVFVCLRNPYNYIIERIPHESTYDFPIKVPKTILQFKKTVLLNKRQKNVKYAVGMIVTHRDEPTDISTCSGVIIGWHRHVDTYVTFSLKDSYRQWLWSPCMSDMPLNHCSNSNFTTAQTNYIILTENNKMCYVGEDAITSITSKWIDNSEIGRYFWRFKGTHYVPNKMLAKLYPQDAAITA